MWIELIGLPGTGKTTMVEQNSSAIRSYYKIVRSDNASIVQRVIAKLLYHFRYKSLTESNALAKKLAYRHSFRFFESRNKDIFFYDSGVMQVILENLIETNFATQEQVLALMSEIPLPDKAIFITDEIEDIALREVNRTTPRFNLTLSETIKRYKIAHQITEQELLHKVKFANTVCSQQTKQFIKEFENEKAL